MDPLKFIKPYEKKMLLGGIMASMTAYAERALQMYVPDYPIELKQQLDPHLPPNGEIIATAAPLGLWVPVKIVKSPSTKEKLRDLAFGATLFAAPRLMQRIGVNIANAEGIAARPTAGVRTPTSGTYQVSTPEIEPQPTPQSKQYGTYRLS